jgi:hypothetical protein
MLTKDDWVGLAGTDRRKDIEQELREEFGREPTIE